MYISVSVNTYNIQKENFVKSHNQTADKMLKKIREI